MDEIWRNFLILLIATMSFMIQIFHHLSVDISCSFPIGDHLLLTSMDEMSGRDHSLLTSDR